MTRVRVVTVPLSDYHRWLLSVTHHNVNAGEDIRYLPRDIAGEIPADDWWVIDNERVAYNLWNESGGPAGLAITTDPRIVEYSQNVRRRLWENATSFAEFNEKMGLNDRQ